MERDTKTIAVFTASAVALVVIVVMAMLTTVARCEQSHCVHGQATYVNGACICVERPTP